MFPTRILRRPSGATGVKGPDTVERLDSPLRRGCLSRANRAEPPQPSITTLSSLSPVPSRRPTPRSRVHTPSFSNCPPCLSPDPSAPERNENSENSKCKWPPINWPVPTRKLRTSFELDGIALARLQNCVTPHQLLPPLLITRPVKYRGKGAARISGRFNSRSSLHSTISARHLHARSHTHSHVRAGDRGGWGTRVTADGTLETIDRVLLNHAGVWREPRGIFHRGRSPGRRAKERHLGGG